MIQKTIGPEWHDMTCDGKPNFIWAVKRYFNIISAEKNLKDITINQEYANYVNYVFKNINVNLPIYEYDEEAIQEVLFRILKYSKGVLSDDTIKHSYTHLVFRPCEYYYKEFQKDDNPLWGTSLSLIESGADKDALYTLKRSFDPNEEKRIVRHLLSHPDTQEGEGIGLATSFCTGARNNETCGFNFGDIIEMKRYPGHYYIRLYETTTLHSSILKSGGKTINAPRLIPLIDAYVDFIFKRKSYLEAIIQFPLVHNKQTYKSIDDIPVACRGNSFASRCRADDLSSAGRILFRDKLKMREVDVAQINAERLAAVGEDAVEKDVTTYAFRRNFATRCFNSGFSRVELEYIMGHKITDPRYRRFDFIDEDYLCEMYNKLKNNPINSYYYDIVR